MTRKQVLQIFLVFLAMSAILAVWMWGVRRAFPVPPPESQDDLYKGIPRETNPWLEPWQRWDTPHYQAIAERGYSAFDTALFTPPLYPLLMRLGSALFGGNTLASGLFVSALAFLGYLLAFFLLAKLELPAEKDALRATIYLALFPTAFFLLAAYSESLYLLTATLSLLFARKGKWGVAGLFGGLAALTRVPGALMAIPLGWAAWEAWRKGDRRAWLAPLLAGAGALAFPLYVRLGLGLPPTAILDALNARGGGLTVPGWNLIEAGNRIVHAQLVGENALELAFALLFTALTFAIWKKLPRLYGVYSAAMMLFFLARLGSPQPLSSMARYVLEIVPAFLLLALAGRNPWIHRLVAYASGFGLLFFSAQFAIWG
ncbi:MAG: mannosyltransferase family protein, partial [Chloroflexota bacterium]